MGIATGCSVFAGLIPEYRLLKNIHIFKLSFDCSKYLKTIINESFNICLLGFIINFWGNRSESKGLGQSPGRRMAIFYLSIFLALLGAIELFLSAQRKKIGATVTSFFFFQSYRSMLTGVASQENLKRWNSSVFIIDIFKKLRPNWKSLIQIFSHVSYFSRPKCLEFFGELWLPLLVV